MSFFNKVLASVGIGSAQVDTKLEKDVYHPGEEVRGIVEIIGGKVEQEIAQISLQIMTTYIREFDDKKVSQTAAIDKYLISKRFTIGQNERKEIPFSFQLPIDTPITIGKTRVWIRTDLDIKNAIDPDDKDFIRVVPYSLQDAVLNAVSNLGFVLQESDCEAAPRKFRTRLPFIQEFEFVPRSGPFRKKLDELEIVFLPKSETSLEIIMQIDRKARGLGSFFAEVLDMDETYVRLYITNGDIPYLQEKLYETINRYS